MTQTEILADVIPVTVPAGAVDRRVNTGQACAITFFDIVNGSQLTVKLGSQNAAEIPVEIAAKIVSRVSKRIKDLFFTNRASADASLTVVASSDVELDFFSGRAGKAANSLLSTARAAASNLPCHVHWGSSVGATSQLITRGFSGSEPLDDVGFSDDFYGDTRTDDLCFQLAVAGAGTGDERGVYQHGDQLPIHTTDDPVAGARAIGHYLGTYIRLTDPGAALYSFFMGFGNPQWATSFSNLFSFLGREHFVGFNSGQGTTQWGILFRDEQAGVNDLELVAGSNVRRPTLLEMIVLADRFQFYVDGALALESVRDWLSLGHSTTGPNMQGFAGLYTNGAAAMQAKMLWKDYHQFYIDNL